MVRYSWSTETRLSDKIILISLKYLTTGVETGNRVYCEHRGTVKHDIRFSISVMSVYCGRS